MKLVLVLTLGMVSVACVYTSTANCPEISRLSTKITDLHRQLFRRMQQATKFLQSAVFQTKCIRKRCYMTDQSGLQTPPPPPGKPCCQKDWKLVNGTCYSISLKGVSWFYAQIDCHSHGATLMRPDTNDKIKWLTETVMSNKKTLWIGITDLGLSGKYTYFSTGEDVQSFNFRKGQPDGGNQHCIESVVRSGGQWHDDVCEGRHGRVCQKAADLC